MGAHILPDWPHAFNLTRLVCKRTWSATRERTFTSRNQNAFFLEKGDNT